MSPRAKKPKPTTPKPHRTAFAMAEPCVRCGYEWGLHVITIIEDAGELPIHAVCGRCMHRLGGAPTQEGE